jgi:hypothetical protein
MTFEQADTAMNAFWSICVSQEFWAEHDRTIPDLTTLVYLAFDAGEYRRRTEPPDTDLEAKYTIRSLLSFWLSMIGLRRNAD